MYCLWKIFFTLIFFVYTFNAKLNSACEEKIETELGKRKNIETNDEEKENCKKIKLEKKKPIIRVVGELPTIKIFPSISCEDSNSTIRKNSEPKKKEYDYSEESVLQFSPQDSLEDYLGCLKHIYGTDKYDVGESKKHRRCIDKPFPEIFLDDKQVMAKQAYFDCLKAYLQSQKSSTHNQNGGQ